MGHNTSGVTDSEYMLSTAEKSRVCITFFSTYSCFVMILITTRRELRFLHFKWSSVGKASDLPEHYVTGLSCMV